MKVILINGASKSGKDTVAEILKNHYSKVYGEEEVLVVPNAQKVKECATEYFDWDGEKDDKGKRLLIDISAVGYKYDPHHWEIQTHKTCLNYSKQFTEVEVLIVPDWRYLSTYDYFAGMYGNDYVITIRVERPNYDNGYAEYVQNDATEQEFLDHCYDSVLLNSSTLESLTAKVYHALAYFI